MNSSLHFFTVPALAPGDAQHELNLFLQQQRVVALEKQWVADGSASYWSLCVTVLNGPGPLPASLRAPGAGHTAKTSAKVDYREVLNEADFAMFADLRNLRARLAQAEGVPPYALFSNEQLACMVRQRVLTSQHFANAYLDGADRFLLAHPAVRAHVRYRAHSQAIEAVAHAASAPDAALGTAPGAVTVRRRMAVQAKPNPKKSRSRRCLDQQRAERALGPAQPERARQAQQQPGFPVCSELNGRCAGVDAPRQHQGCGPNSRPVAGAAGHRLKPQGPRGAGRQQPNAPRAAVRDAVRSLFFYGPPHG